MPELRSVMASSPSATWPFDVLWPIRPAIRIDERPKVHGSSALSCFVIQSSESRERNEFVFSAVNEAVIEANRMINARTPGDDLVMQADRSETPGVIHSQIWEGIRSAEIVVVDITGYRHNVMYEAGVAATIKGPERVILIRDRRV